MKRIKISYILLTLNFLGMTLFWLRLSAPTLEAAANFFPAADSHGAFLAAQANHYALLQLYLVIFSIVIAGGAFWGYTEIKRAAELSVANAIKDSMPGMMQKHLIAFGKEEIAKMLVEMAEKKLSQKNSASIFDQYINEMILSLED